MFQVHPGSLPALPFSSGPETSEHPQMRDDCVIMNGQEECVEAIEAHKACLRSEGFDIR